MRVIFFGTPPFAARVLEALIANKVTVAAVVSKPDKSKGRSGTPVPTAVKQFLQSQSLHIPIYQPEKCSTAEFASLLKTYAADLFIVVAYGEIISQEILDIPRKGCVNIHASLLPKLRGAAPIQRAIMNGDKTSGITIMHMVRKMDAGDIIDQYSIDITPDMTFGELEKAMVKVAPDLLMRTIKSIENQTAKRIIQDESEVTFAPKIELEDCQINWDLHAEDIHNLVRGVNPYPGAWTVMKLRNEKKRVKILRSKPMMVPSSGFQIGTVMNDKNNIRVVCGQGLLEILELQVEGKKPTTAAEFLRGYSQDQIEIIA